MLILWLRPDFAAAQGKDDQATVLTTTAGTAVEYVSSDEEAVGDQFHHGSPDSMSPLRKKMKGDREGVAGGNQLNVGRLAADPVTRDTTSLSYRVSVSGYLWCCSTGCVCGVGCGHPLPVARGWSL